jgi:hypothetical protein
MTDLRITLDDREIRAYLDKFTRASVAKVLRKASSEAGKAMKPLVKAATPRGKTGNLQRSVRSRRIRGNPAIGQVVGPMGRQGAHRHLVEFGTRPHRIVPETAKALSWPGALHPVSRSIHPGAQPHAFVSSVAGSALDAGYAAAERVIDAAIEGSSIGESTNE